MVMSACFGGMGFEPKMELSWDSTFFTVCKVGVESHG